MKYLLINTDGYGISVMEYSILADAQAVMRKQYDDYGPSRQGFEEMSKISETDAILYTEETVHVWKIHEV